MEICKAPQEGAHNPQTEEGTIYPSIYLSVSFIRGLRTGRCPQCTQEKCGVLHSAHWGWGLWHCGRTSRSPSDMCELLCKVHAPQTPAPLRLSDPELFMKSCSECSLCSPLCPQLTPNCCQEYFLLFTPCSLLLPWLQEGVPSAVAFSWQCSFAPQVQMKAGGAILVQSGSVLSQMGALLILSGCSQSSPCFFNGKDKFQFTIHTERLFYHVETSYKASSNVDIICTALTKKKKKTKTKLSLFLTL